MHQTTHSMLPIWVRKLVPGPILLLALGHALAWNGLSAAADETSRLSVQPAAIVLNGADDGQQVAVTRIRADGSLLDATSPLEWPPSERSAVW